MKLKGFLFVAAASGVLATIGQARMLRKVSTQTPSLSPAYKTAAGCLPSFQQCTHRVGRLWFNIINNAAFGARVDNNTDCLTGKPTPLSAEFPGGSRIDYLFQGGLWIGAVVGGDTLVSIATDGVVLPGYGEFHSDCEGVGDIIRHSRNPASPYYDSVNAVSDMDLIAVMYDTLTDPFFVTNPDPGDGRWHKPMSLKVIQRSYSWAAGWGQDWVMLDYSIVNLGRKPLSEVYFGIYVDADVGHVETQNSWDDDLSGFKVWVPNPEVPTCPDTINLAYIYDNDGDPGGDGTYRPNSPTGVTGIRVVRAPVPLNRVKTTFNWWYLDLNNNVALDWGPQKAPGRKNFSGGRGQPKGDAMKYYYLSNGEIDYDQVWSAVNQNTTDYGFSTGWLPPLTEPSAKVDIASGQDTRFLVSYGPFNLKPLADDPSDTLRLTLAYIAGEGFHRAPLNFATNLGATPDNYTNPVKIEEYQKNLNFQSVATNARWVQRVFDNETGVDTVLCGQPPQKVARRHGDGIPDFKGPLPPPVPATEALTNEGEIVLRWFGKKTENAKDDFVGEKDFEGYRIQMSSDGRNYTIVGSFDKLDWKPYFLNKRKIDTIGTLGTWQPTETRPLSWEEIQCHYAVKWDTSLNRTDPTTGALTLGRPIDPNRFNAPTGVRSDNSLPEEDPCLCNPDTTRKALAIRFCDNCGPFVSPVDTIFYFAPQDYNLGLAQAKLYPSVTDSTNDSSYWYQFKISGLLPAQPVYMAVTPFDFGLLTPYSRLDPQEATPTSAARLIYPLPNEESRRFSYALFTYDAGRGGWRPSPAGILNYSKIQELYASQWDTCRTRAINPEKFNAPDFPALDPTRCNPDTTRKALAIRFCDNCGPGGAPVDSLFYFSLSDTFKISVFPNPYRIDQDYSHYENPNRVSNRNPELHRKLNFINLPSRCVIRIYTLDGDLVQQINHDKDPQAGDAGYETWDLLSRNAQPVVSGLYLYTVQSSQGVWTEDGLKSTYVGKIVIIK